MNPSPLCRWLDGCSARALIVAAEQFAPQSPAIIQHPPIALLMWAAVDRTVEVDGPSSIEKFERQLLELVNAMHPVAIAFLADGSAAQSRTALEILSRWSGVHEYVADVAGEVVEEYIAAKFGPNAVAARQTVREIAAEMTHGLGSTSLRPSLNELLLDTVISAFDALSALPLVGHPPSVAAAAARLGGAIGRIGERDHRVRRQLIGVKDVSDVLLMELIGFGTRNRIPAAA